jgi:hypothetical protein
VELRLGDCAVMLPTVLAEIQEPAVYWLDAHYSAGITGRGIVDDPILISLGHLAAHPIKDNILLIDDARCFDGSQGRPTLDDIFSAIRRVNSHYTIQVHHDVVVATPPNRTRESLE